MANKNYIKIKRRLKLNEKSEFYLKSKVDSSNEDEIKNCIAGIRCIENEIIEESENKEETERIQEAVPCEEKAEGHTDVISSNKILILTKKADIVRIFDAMYDTDMISTQSTIKQIAELFFNEVKAKTDFVKIYNSTKDQMEKNESSTNSKKILRFIMLLAERSFRHKRKELDQLINFLVTLRKNII
ncbi:MAG: hypothetical protein WCE54_10565 [Ignavibacteriaceae bacterium]